MVTATWRTCRFGGKTANQQHLNFTGKRIFSQGNGMGVWIIKGFVIFYLDPYQGMSHAVFGELVRV
jgi:Na+-transporting NADH:ubiquinone oxidoreductase subunit NqrC